MRHNFRFRQWFDRIVQSDKANILILILIWVFMVWLVNPIGEFPLNDDWVHARAVRTLLDNGQFTLADGHSSSNLFALVYWGALFCLPFGFSFTALRVSTLVLGLVGVVTFYGLTRLVVSNPKTALFCALLVALNPIYFSLSNTFMTDVPFLTTILLGFYFFIKGLQQDQEHWVWIGYLWLYISILIRQLSIVFPLAFGCAYLVKKGWSKVNFFKALVPALVGIFLNSAYTFWLETTGRTSPILNQKLNIMLDLVFSENFLLNLRIFISNLIALIIFLSLFASILLIPLFIHRYSILSGTEKRLISLVIPFLSIVLMYPLVTNKFDIPLSGGAGHILAYFGIGPITLHDTLVLNTNYPVLSSVGRLLWLILKMSAALTTAIFLYYFFIAPILKISKPKQASSSSWLGVLLILSIILYLVPMILYGFFDRYLLPLLPLTLLFALYVESEGRQNIFNSKIIV